MRPIPTKLRKQLSNDPWMKQCIYENCANEPEWEHSWIYSGRQINERWAIVPVCYYHHRGEGLDKDFNRYKSLQRATLDELEKYPRVNWMQKWIFLSEKYDV